MTSEELERLRHETDLIQKIINKEQRKKLDLEKILYGGPIA